MIEVGDYVRSNLGSIGKVTKIEQSGIYKGLYDDKELITIDKNVVKHSKNIIDLIEYGDLVKFKGWGKTKGINVMDMRTNEKINLVFPDAEFCNGWSDNCMIYDLDYLIEKDQSNKIDWVLTHEQIKNNCYSLEENK